MYLEISAIAAVIIFAILTFFIIRTLILAQRSLRRIDDLSQEFTGKIKQLDSTVNSIEHIGDICEEESANIRNHYFKKKNLECNHEDCTDDLASLLALSIKIGSKFFRR